MQGLRVSSRVPVSGSHQQLQSTSILQLICRMKSLVTLRCWSREWQALRSKDDEKEVNTCITTHLLTMNTGAERIVCSTSCVSVLW